MRSACISLSALLSLLACGCAPPPEVVSRVDVSRYMGRWYEIARFPAPFQDDCVATTATYGLREDGKVSVLNACREETFDGPIREVEGVARVVDPQTNAKLKVTFAWPFEGDYWIIMLDDSYRWAVVSDPWRKYLWILNRAPHMDDADFESILARLIDRGFDLDRLMLTPQPPGGDALSHP